MQSAEVAEAPPETPEPERAQLLPPTLQDDIVSQALAMGALQFGVPELWRAAHTSRGARLLALKESERAKRARMYPGYPRGNFCVGAGN